MLVPPSAEGVVDNRHRDSSHARVDPPRRPHRVVPRPGPEERLLPPSASGDFPNRRPAPFVDQDVLPRRELQDGPPAPPPKEGPRGPPRPAPLPSVSWP